MHKLILLYLFCLLSIYSSAQNMGAVLFKTGFSSPVDITNAADGTNRLFVVEQAGIIKIIPANRQLAATTFLNITTKVSAGGEKGLLGLAFHPDYKNNGFFYVNYTTTNSTIIARYSVNPANPNLADAASEKILMTISQPYDNHNGGCLKFSPIDGYLYIGMGDGGSGGDPQCYAQNTNSYLGKMLRLDVNTNVNTAPYYGIPPDNPYIGLPNHKPEIWAIGLRNPWRFSFDRANGDLWIADVDQGAKEEINKTPSNTATPVNYGWKVMEGRNCYDNTNCGTNINPCNSSVFAMPYFDYGRSSTTGGFSVTGGFVYRGCDFPAMKGKYIFADYGSNNAWLDTIIQPTFKSNVTGVSAFGEDENGELYCVKLSNGRVFRVIDTNVPLNKTLTGSISNNELAADTLFVQAPISFTGDTLKLASRNVLLSGSQQINGNQHFKIKYTGGCND